MNHTDRSILGTAHAMGIWRFEYDLSGMMLIAEYKMTATDDYLPGAGRSSA